MSTNADKPQFRSLLAWPLALTALYLIGFYLFANGFLLSRSALDTASTCNDTLAFAFDKPEGSCWGLNKHKQAYQQPSLNSPNTCVTTRKRVVLLVVDALRYDFVAPQIDSNLPFHNQLPYMQSSVYFPLFSSVLCRSPNKPLHWWVADCSPTRLGIQSCSNSLLMHLQLPSSV
eukprot:m.167726 g.167726  ORF g.167726 m.167726 type:complete len:174 (-) comp16641_c0_seq20:3571-4092(-)